MQEGGAASLTCAGSSTNRNQVGPVLCDGLDGQLVLTQRSLLHDGDGGQRSSLRALDDAADSAYRRGRDGGKRLHFHWSRKEASPVVPEGTALLRA